MSSHLPRTIGDLERAISQMEDELTSAALTIGRETLTHLHREDRCAHPFLAGEMDGVSHDSLLVGLRDERGADAQLLYIAGFALGWDNRRLKPAS